MLFSDEFEAGKNQGKISAVDYAIFDMLRESNLLEKTRTETSTASPVGYEFYAYTHISYEFYILLQ